MNTISIPINNDFIKVDPLCSHAEDVMTWNVMPLLNEVKHALTLLIEDGKTSCIDLRAIPLAPGEEDKIIEQLGQGEVRCQLHAMGLSEIIETRFSGVWLVTHFNEESEIMSRCIEICKMPAILCSQSDDMRLSCQELTDSLQEQQVNNSPVEENQA